MSPKAKLDANGFRGIFSKGKPVYRGGSMTPNPTGENGARAARLMLARRRKVNGSRTSR